MAPLVRAAAGALLAGLFAVALAETPEDLKAGAEKDFNEALRKGLKLPKPQPPAPPGDDPAAAKAKRDAEDKASQAEAEAALSDPNVVDLSKAKTDIPATARAFDIDEQLKRLYVGPEVLDALDRIAKAYLQKTKQRLTVTSGTRDPAAQAEAMFEYFKGGQKGFNYKAVDLKNQVKAKYDEGLAAGKGREPTVADMAKVIADMPAADQKALSLHMVGNAFDLRKTGTDGQVLSEIVAAENQRLKDAKAGRQLKFLDKEPTCWHVQVQRD